MKIDMSYQIELCASKDDTRPSLRHAYYQPDKARIVATDGHRLAIVPVTVDPGDTAGYVTDDALKAARKVGRKVNGIAEIAANGTLHTGAGAFPRPTEGTFPPVDAVIPEYRAGADRTASVTFNPELLTGIVKAIGAAKGPVTLTFDPEDPYAAIVVTAADNGTIGVLMPMRR